jgi:hypothetical protein
MSVGLSRRKRRWMIVHIRGFASESVVGGWSGQVVEELATERQVDKHRRLLQSHYHLGGKQGSRQLE